MSFSYSYEILHAKYLNVFTYFISTLYAVSSSFTYNLKLWILSVTTLDLVEKFSFHIAVKCCAKYITLSKSFSGSGNSSVLSTV
jgi:hypothetical protein